MSTYFLSDTLKKVKLGVGVIGGLVSIGGLVYGGITLNVGLNIVSSIFLVQSAFLLGDGAKIMKDVQDYIIGLRSNNQSLSESVEDLERISYNYQREVKKFSDALKEAEAHNHQLLKQLEHERIEFQSFSQKLTQENKELGQTKEELKLQIIKLKELHENSKALIKNLVMAGDAFTQFQNEFGEASRNLRDTSSDLDETSGDLQQTVELLKGIVQRLSKV